MNLLTLVPYKMLTFELPCSCESFQATVRRQVRGSIWDILGYMKYQGEYVGSISDNTFLVTQCVRRVWLPIVFGRVGVTEAGCLVALKCFSPAGSVFLASIILFVILLARAGSGLAVIVVAPLVGLHFAACLQFEKEVDHFLVSFDLKAEDGDAVSDGLE